MPNLARALVALKRMAHLLDTNAAQLAAPSRYDRVTNDYQAALQSAFEAWASGLLRDVRGKSTDEQKTIIDASAGALSNALNRVTSEHLPYAVNAIGTSEYIPSPDAWRMIADAIDAQTKDIDARLVPFVTDKLRQGVTDGLELRGVADSLLPRVGFYAGTLWATIQRLVGDFANQASIRDDLIYRCRWVRVPDDHSCQSCVEFAGEYASYDELLKATNECVPGYFVGSPYNSCWLNCRCHIELLIDGRWTRL